MIHKLRNPLSVVITAASQLELREGETVSADDVEFADAVKMAADTIEDILARFSRYACPEPNELEYIDINSVCRAEFDQIIDSIPESRQPQCNLQLAADLPEIMTDALKFRMILSELLRNAISALSGNGLVTLRTEIIGADVRVTIEDDGPGMAGMDMDYICEPFVTARPGGTGLGLAIAMSLVGQIGGTLNLDAPRGAGLRARILLPLNTDVRE